MADLITNFITKNQDKKDKIKKMKKIGYLTQSKAIFLFLYFF